MKHIFTRFLITICILFACIVGRADEGMWVPLFLNKNLSDMQEKGFKLSSEDLYSMNNASLKDAIMQIGGCTAELISEKGLLLTNHHCGLSQIQFHSSVKNNYLENGFWAKSQENELPCPGMFARIVVSIEDVTNVVLNSYKSSMTESKRDELIKKNTDKLVSKKKKENKKYTYVVSKMFEGNQFLLFTYEVFNDVRLVGAPPISVGKFGGDTDNWMWPRHTGDFTMFRVYADENNQASEYSITNRPYKPKKFFPISLQGAEKGDFTFIYGFPGTTMQYLPSFALENVINLTNPHKIHLRTQRLDQMTSTMQTSADVRIKYTSKHAGIANAWKKWQGESIGLKRLNAIESKQKLETKFQSWADANPSRKEQYSHILPAFKNIYTENGAYENADTYYREGLMGVEVINFASKFEKFLGMKGNEKNFVETKESLLKSTELFYKDYYAGYDIAVFPMMLMSYDFNVYKDIFKDKKTVVFNLIKKENGNVDQLSEREFAKTIFTDKQAIVDVINNPTEENKDKIRTDFFYKFWSDVKAQHEESVLPTLKENNLKLVKLKRDYMRGLMEMEPNKLFYPNANSTLRVAYGKVEGFSPKDGVEYKHYTTLQGIMEKYDTGNPDYVMPSKLRELCNNKDYGQYANSKGELPVAFIATNHTTGGNSGSPLLNAKGELIGINFDRCWESTMSDYEFDPNYCRNISVDIRYVLFIVDKYANAKHLLDEMKIVK